MLTVPPPQFRKRRGRRKVRFTPPPGAALVLVHASFAPSAMALTLDFDRPIDIDAIDGAQIFVNDGDFHNASFNAAGGILSFGAAHVVLQLSIVGPYAAGGVQLSASPSNGIMAVDDAGTWPGITDLALPFP